jgi:O-antigen/teichoic acid export membrane protein
MVHIGQLGTKSIVFFVFMVLARFVAPQEFGLIAVAHVIVTFVRQTVFDAIAHPVARTTTPSDALYSRAFSVSVLIAIATTAVMLAGAGLVSGFYAYPVLMPVYFWWHIYSL